MIERLKSFQRNISRKNVSWKISSRYCGSARTNIIGVVRSFLDKARRKRRSRTGHANSIVSFQGLYLSLRFEEKEEKKVPKA
jgi:hypothetical protein